MKKFLSKPAVVNVFTSLICIILGLLISYIVLLFINPANAHIAIFNVLANFFNFDHLVLQLFNFGNTLVKTAPLLMCALSVIFCYKAGMFNIGVAGEYCAGICTVLFCAITLKWNWFFCILAALLAGLLVGLLIGLFKILFNVNEVISGIMINWIILYLTNYILGNFTDQSSAPYTKHLLYDNKSAIIPSLGLDKLFADNRYITIAIPLSILLAIITYIVLKKTKFGFEIRATGYNKDAAKYAGMKEKNNIILTLMIGGAIAAVGASFLYLTDIEQWKTTTANVPNMGFDGIAAAFLGCLNPIGAIFSSYFVQHITCGGAYVDTRFFTSQVSQLVSSIIIYLCGFTFFIKYIIERIKIAREAKSKNNRSTNSNGVGD